MMGPLMMDCSAELLTAEEREMLAHPLTGGIILFSRNYYDQPQLTELIRQIRDASKTPLIIAVDHEGGRVQRFKQDFTHLPAMGQLTELTSTKEEAGNLARDCGVIMAYELKSMDIDLSFAPVLDINGISNVIGDRGLADNASDVIVLARELIAGMRLMNMPTTGKHFPGHGSVEADSHIAVPVDDRSLETILEVDTKVFKACVTDNLLDAIMPAHVIYSAVDPQPAGFSSYWLQTMLRQQFGFTGVIFSDDLSMEGAKVAGNYYQRGEAALLAGCDMILACNNPAGAVSILDNLSHNFIGNPRLSQFVHHALPKDAKKYYEASIDALKKALV
ncbi:beta-N-acetylhexosaminidase [Alteromonas sp. ASW11-130]|uniref:beta-N-acetylhexosaminidase n=1 Tax=Alteromonas sp. ASW11-130 TaxID=3015775 RepID=UPI0022421465|nr:beta-N-acetylhexosaminidase [Alteromonas sp. ASW11-130]MCW8090619.1 beta-N-acetylhexosaminidase [Alteromonas sp. ASW11-130]